MEQGRMRCLALNNSAVKAQPLPLRCMGEKIDYAFSQRVTFLEEKAGGLSFSINFQSHAGDVKRGDWVFAPTSRMCQCRAAERAGIISSAFLPALEWSSGKIA
jgi:hypothetical protein